MSPIKAWLTALYEYAKHKITGKKSTKFFRPYALNDYSYAELTPPLDPTNFIKLNPLKMHCASVVDLADSKYKRLFETKKAPFKITPTLKTISTYGDWEWLNPVATSTEPRNKTNKH